MRPEVVRDAWICLSRGRELVHLSKRWRYDFIGSCMLEVLLLDCTLVVIISSCNI